MQCACNTILYVCSYMNKQCTCNIGVQSTTTEKYSIVIHGVHANLFIIDKGAIVKQTPTI